MTATKSEIVNATSMARMETKIDTLQASVSDLNKRLFGNGKPGIISEQQNQDTRIEELLKYAHQNADNIEKLREESTPRWITKNWLKILGIFIIVFIIAHSLIPVDATIWSLLSLIK